MKGFFNILGLLPVITVSAATMPHAYLVGESFNPGRNSIEQYYQIRIPKQGNIIQSIPFETPENITKIAETQKNPLLYALEQEYTGYLTYGNKEALATLNGKTNPVLFQYQVSISPSYERKFNQMESTVYEYAQNNQSKQNFSKKIYAQPFTNEPDMQIVPNSPKPKNQIHSSTVPILSPVKIWEIGGGLFFVFGLALIAITKGRWKH